MNGRRRAKPSLAGGELELWRAFIRLSQLLPAALEEDLRARGESLPRYEILAVLANLKRGLRLTELGTFALVSKPRLSVHVTTLEADGFVTREPHPHDRRASIVTLTTSGRRHLARLTPGHLEKARALVIDRIDPLDIPMLLRALAAVLEALGDSWRPRRPEAAEP
jgi:DNA-binding MarR family transcriptional regulator